MEVQTGRRNLAVVDLIARSRGKFYPIKQGGELHVQLVRNLDRQVSVVLSVRSNALWSYDAGTDRFEVTDAKGQRYDTNPYSWALSPGPVEWCASDGLLLTGGSLAGGLAALPWGGIALRQPPVGKLAYSRGYLTFIRPEGAGPPARLTLYRFRRVKAEIPFEFRGLPLP